MAQCKTAGLEGLENLFENLAALPVQVVNDMLFAEADVIIPAQKAKMRVRWSGKYATGKTAESLTKGKIRQKNYDRRLSLEFRGSHHGTPNTEIAFVNEYGKTNQPARSAIREANEESEDRAVEAAADVLDRWIDKHV